MGKEKKGIGIKTARYFTKNCSKCSYEYPNWFTNCPKCGAAWDDAEIKTTAPKEAQRKKIKIVVKITEEDFNKSISNVNLIFSADQGKSWYQMEMTPKTDYYLVEIAEIPIGSVIIYYIEVYLEDGEKIIENNENNYFYYKVGVPIETPDVKPTKIESQTLKENISEKPIIPQEYYQPPQESPKLKTHLKRENLEIPSAPTLNEQIPENTTIFGKPQTRIDPDLKVCKHCNSKIKRMWSICPICGKTL